MTSEIYEEYMKDFDVLEKEGKFYIRWKPNVLYETKEEAEKDAEILRNIPMFIG